MDGTMLLAAGRHCWVVFFFFFCLMGVFFFFCEDELLSFLVDAHSSSLFQVFF